MEIGMIGLGKMGLNMTERLQRGGHRVVAHDLKPDAVAAAVELGVTGVESIADVADALTSRRTVWSMVPAGKPTESVIEELAEILEPDDTVIDGGNSNYRDSVRRAAMVRERGINFIDVGVSGGVWGLENGYGMMIGGPKAVVERLRPIFETLAPGPDKGWGRVGPNGAGHFVKMVHNGIEYGMMQAYAEGFAIMQAKEEFDLDLHHIADIWRYGTVIRSWLLALLAAALEDDQELDDIAAWVDDSGEGRWTVEEAVDLAVPAPVISLALFSRFRSRQPDNYANKLLAVLRHQFGGHAVKEGQL
jgi:6-phosphogluconate dehydrogenase